MLRLGPPGMGDDAVGAEGVAAVLNFQVGPGAAGGWRCEKRGKGLGAAQDPPDRSGGRVRTSADDLRQPVLVSVADHVIDPGDGFDLFRRHLGVAAGDGDAGAGIFTDGAADGAPALHGRAAGHGAGVDDAQIRGMVRRRGPPAISRQGLYQTVRFILVDLAPQGHDPERPPTHPSIHPAPTTSSPT